jgi:predicted Ser/Thr protein kinase
MSDAVPNAIGPYEPTQMLAIGAQSQVWLADGPDGQVVLKLARTDAHRDALRREVEVRQLGDHAGLVPMIDADVDAGWLALRHIEGPTLDQWSKQQPMEEILALTLQLLDVLQHLHGHGIIHADIKPTNVLVDAHGKPHLIDLGVARREGEVTDGFKGTLGYAAPELLKGAPATKATDMYGLGALLYSCITGRTPFVAPDPAALTYLPLVSLPPPPAAFVPDIPSAVNQLLLALLAREPARRPSSLERVRNAIAAAESSNPPPPVLGMLEEREALRRAVVGAADGEPRIVVLYGPPGSGRRTLIAEAVEYARREGLPYLKGADPKTLLQTLRKARQPTVLVMRGASKAARQLAQILIKENLSCLLLLHADRPLPALSQLGAILLTPAPLTEKDALRLARMYLVDSDDVGEWWKETMGLPVALLGRFRAWRRDEGLSEVSTSSLPGRSKQVYEALRRKPKMRAPVASLAAELDMGEHTFLDHCEVLFAEQLIEPQQDGEMIAVVTSRSAR